jgi:hypothetical protein
MKLIQFIDFIRNRLKTVVKVCLAILALLVLLDALFVDKEHAHTSIEHIPGFWAVFGLLGCMILIILSKAFGHLGIMTREDYYDE